MAATGDPVPCSFCGKYGHDFGEVCRGITNTYPTTPVNSPTPPPAPEPSEEIRRVVRIFEGCRVPLPGDCEGCDALATLIEKREAPLRRDLEAARGERCPHAFDMEKDALYEGSPTEEAGKRWCGDRGLVGVVTVRRDVHAAIGALLTAESRASSLERDLAAKTDSLTEVFARVTELTEHRDRLRVERDAANEDAGRLRKAMNDAIVQVYGGADAGDDRHAKVSCGLAFDILADALLAEYDAALAAHEGRKG